MRKERQEGAKSHKGLGALIRILDFALRTMGGCVMIDHRLRSRRKLPSSKVLYNWWILSVYITSNASIWFRHLSKRRCQISWTIGLLYIAFPVSQMYIDILRKLFSCSGKLEKDTADGLSQ